MRQEWQLDAPKGRCAVTGRELGEREEFYSVLFEDEAADGVFLRRAGSQDDSQEFGV